MYKTVDWRTCSCYRHTVKNPILLKKRLNAKEKQTEQRHVIKLGGLMLEIQQGQKVIDTGLYGIVRHPMYSVTIIMFLSMPLVLGSILSFAVFLAYPIIIAKRILYEETVLEKELEGYITYKKKVKYKMIPFVW